MEITARAAARTRGGVGREGVAGADGPVGGEEAAVAAPGGDGAQQDQDAADELAAAGAAERRGERTTPSPATSRARAVRTQASRVRSLAREKR